MPFTYSTVLPNYNDAGIIGRQIESIFSQEKVPDEVLVCDDGSTDNSLEVLAKLQAVHPQLRVLVNEKNLGTLLTSNRLMNEARGDYLSFSAADDQVCPDFCAATDRWLQRHPEIPIVLGQVELLDENGGIYHVVRASRFSESGVINADLYRREIFEVEPALASFSPSFFIRRDVAIRHGGFRPMADLYSDTLLIHVTAMEGGCIYLHQPCTRFQYSARQGSERLKKNRARIRTMIQNLGEILSTPQYRGLFDGQYVRHWQRRIYDAYVQDALYRAAIPHLRSYLANREKPCPKIPFVQALWRWLNAIAYRLTKWPVEARERWRWRWFRSW